MKNLVGVAELCLYEEKKENIGVGVQKFGGENPKNGKKLGVGVILDRFGKRYHTFPGFSPGPPPPPDRG